MLKGIKNIIFDLGGVVLNIDYFAAVKAFEGYGIKAFDAHYSQMKQSPLFDDFEIGKVTPCQFRKAMRTHVDASLTDFRINKAWNAIILDFPPERIAFLDQIKNNYRTFLLSNTNKIHYNLYQKALKKQGYPNGLDDLFEKTYFSFKVGLRKPDAAIFNQLIHNEGILPEETLFIDDTFMHIETAQSLGFRTYHLNPKTEDISSLLKTE